MRKMRFLGAASAVCLLLAGCTGTQKPAGKQEEGKVFTAFMAVPGKVLPRDNRIMNRIADKIGAKAKITWLDSQTAEEMIQVMNESGEYPDFIDGSDATKLLIEAGALIPLDEYIEEYPNIIQYLSEEEWNRLRQKDGHIYVIPQFGVTEGETMTTQHPDEAFWIQKRVLKWAGYPTVRTLDEYFDLIEAYLEANPESEGGKKNIGFEILCDDWRYFCLENPPQFLAGYPNDGCGIVDSDTLEVSVYDDLPEARQYYQRLNREYERGVLDQEAFTLSYDQYLEKIASGRVLGMVDQYWQFQTAELALRENGMDDRTYVPLGITANEDIVDAYRTKPIAASGKGIGITISCEDVEGALQFLNDLLEPEIQILRTWGEEGIDYEVGEDGIFYRTQEQRLQEEDSQWALENKCPYSYFPHTEGMLEDGKNAAAPGEQPGEYYATLTEGDRELLDAYGYEKWTDFLTLVKENPPWFPLYSALDTWSADTPYGKAREEMERVKREWLPKVIMAGEEQFDEMWEEYQKSYHSQVDVEAYERELTEEVARRAAMAESDTIE